MRSVLLRFAIVAQLTLSEEGTTYGACTPQLIAAAQLKGKNVQVVGGELPLGPQALLGADFAGVDRRCDDLRVSGNAPTAGFP